MKWRRLRGKHKKIKKQLFPPKIMTDLEKLAGEAQEKVFSHMRETRPGKYDGIFAGLKAFRYLMLLQTKGDVPEAFRRGNFLVSYYVLNRFIDDIVDKDAPPPLSARSRQEYVEHRLAFASNPVSPTDTADFLIMYCYQQAARLGFSISEETNSILLSMLFDARRIEAAERNGAGLIFPEQELHANFYLCDIEGTGKGLLKLLGDSPERMSLVMPIGTADRIKLTLKDLVADVKVGLINIPQEDMERYGISTADLGSMASSTRPLPLDSETLPAALDALPQGVRAWVRDKAVKGLELIAQTKEIVRTHKFNLSERLILRFVYGGPSERYFTRLSSALSSA